MATDAGVPEYHPSMVPAGVLLALRLVRLKFPEIQVLAWFKFGAVFPALQGAGEERVMLNPSTEKYEPFPEGNEVVEASI